jgi:hypothetical protein
VYSTSSPPICIPGLLGLRCRTRTDCLFGECVPANGGTTNSGFNVCSVRCTSNEECAKYDSIHGTFFCNSEGWCAGARGMLGGDCHGDNECHHQAEGEFCATAAPDGTALCQYQCDPTKGCPNYGGVPHVCRPQFKNGNIALEDRWFCWPGSMGALFCNSDASCLPSLSCLPAHPLFNTCSISCMKDDDCNSNHFTAGGWCDPMFHICKEAIDDGGACERGPQCLSKTCLENKTCATSPGY